VYTAGQGEAKLGGDDGQCGVGALGRGLVGGQARFGTLLLGGLGEGRFGVGLVGRFIVGERLVEFRLGLWGDE
jgi:hypothetical protein